MLDQKQLRTDIENVALNLAKHGYELDISKFNELEAQRKDLSVKTQDLQNERNTKSKSIGKAKASGEDITPLLAEVSTLGDDLDAAKKQLDEVQGQIHEMMMGMPNLLDDSVPEGKSEDDILKLENGANPLFLILKLKIM